MYLSLDIKGVTKARLGLGLASAMEVFKARGLTPVDAATGKWKRELWDMKGFPADDAIATERDLTAADVWDEAERAAYEAACPTHAGWPRPPGDGLALIIERAEQANAANR